MRAFYSKTSALVVNINPGSKKLNSVGVIEVFGGKTAEFTPRGDGFGWLQTDDPEIITALEKRSDVFGNDQYQDMAMPPELKMQRLKDEAASQQRTIDTQNRLLDQLRAEGKIDNEGNIIPAENKPAPGQPGQTKK